MKNKHRAILVVAVILFSVITVVFWFVREMTAGARPQPPFIGGPLPTIEVPGSETVDEMVMLEAEMERLAYPSGIRARPVHLEIFGYRPMTQGAYKPATQTMIASPQMPYTVSMAFEGGDRGFCVVDGKFYHEGALLPDGARILGVHSTRVLIEKQVSRHWIPVARKSGGQAIEVKKVGGKK
jgi:hypothetical protein